ncbi:hypothetical protein LQW54_006593 [Pestalotiopsis sp. IQ-011]
MAASAAPSIRSQSSRDGEVGGNAPSPPDENDMAGDVGYTAKESETIKDFPWTWKVTALACGIALSWGSSFSEKHSGPAQEHINPRAGHYKLPGKIIVLAAKATAVPMRDATSFWAWALWIPAIVCLANLLQNIFYICRQLVTKSKQYNGTQNANNGPRSMSTISRGLRRFTASSICRAINNVPCFFWLMACTQILQAGVIAGYTSSVQQVVPVICTPLIGLFFDTFGYRMMIISFTSAIWILVYCLIGFTQTNAVGTMVIASLGSAFNAIPFLVSTPLVVTSQAELGLVFGIWKAFNNSGTVVVDMIADRLQDITTGGTYERVITFFVAVKGLEFCLGMYLSGVLTMSEKKRMSAEANNELGEPLGRKPSKLFTVLGMSLLCAIIIVAWVLFIKYSI